MIYNDEKLDVAAMKLYNDFTEFVKDYNNSNPEAFLKLMEIKNDGNKYNENEIKIILSKFIALVFGNYISRWSKC